MRGLAGGGGGGEGAGLKKISSQLQNSFKGTNFVPLKSENGLFGFPEDGISANISFFS